jgi:hypothetical protein
MNSLFVLLDKIKAKPGLYIGRASIADLRMFIVGYRFARSEAKLPATEAENDFYKNFQPWLQLRLNVRTSNAFTVTNEQQAFDYFFQLLEEFKVRDREQDIDPMLFDLRSEAILLRKIA